MKCLLIFGTENAHPLAWMLSRKHRHVWCALQDVERGVWVSYNWHKGLPIIQVESAADYDLAAHYRDQGFTVVEMERGTKPRLFPFILNNCVSHVKVVCALRTFTVTPQWLYRSMTKRKRPMRIKEMFTVPGFGGGSSPAPPPPPPPLPPPPTKADPAVVKSREEEQRRLKLQRGMAGTVKTGSTPLGTATTADKTLLGN
jgi:hypothetical protein